MAEQAPLVTVTERLGSKARIMQKLGRRFDARLSAAARNAQADRRQGSIQSGLVTRTSCR
jgi:hypothetical protein